MKRVLTSITSLLALAAAASAQVGTNYTFAQSVGTYTPITGGTLLATATSAATQDTTTYSVALPFSFPYDGALQTDVRMGSNGDIAFGTTATTTSVPLSSTAVTPGRIGAAGRDLQGGYGFAGTRTSGSNVITAVSAIGPVQVGDTLVGTGIPAATTVTAIGVGTITMSANATSTSSTAAVTAYGPWSNMRWELVGSSPNQEVVLQWSNFKVFGTTLTTVNGMYLNFQIRLREDGRIQCVYGDCTPGIGTTIATVYQVGLRGPTNAFPANINNRLNTKGVNDDWSLSVPGTANTSGMVFNTAAPANVIPNGLTYEWNYAPPACAGTPAPGNVTGAPALACLGSGFTLGLQNQTTGTGVTYQWYSSTVSNAGPWTSLGTLPTQAASQSVTTWYYCDVTCATGPSIGSTTVLQVDMDSPLNPQTFEAGLTGCWSNLGAPRVPLVSTLASGFGVGTSSINFDFSAWSGTDQAWLTSPVLPVPTVAGDRIFYDTAGASWSASFGPDFMEAQESTDGGATWTTIPGSAGDNYPGGLYNTAPNQASSFTPNASQWKNLSFPLSVGVNRVRFVGTTDFGNDVWIDNVSVGPSGFARHYAYGVSCTPGYAVTASPAPTLGATVTYTASGIPQYVLASAYLSVLILGFEADVPGTAMSTVTFGSLDSPCLVHLTLAGFADVVGLYGNVPTDTWNFTVPVGAPLGAELFVQGVAQTDSVFPTNPSGLLTSTALRSYVSNY